MIVRAPLHEGDYAGGKNFDLPDVMPGSDRTVTSSISGKDSHSSLSNYEYIYTKLRSLIVIATYHHQVHTHKVMGNAFTHHAPRCTLLFLRKHANTNVLACVTTRVSAPNPRSSRRNLFLYGIVIPGKKTSRNSLALNILLPRIGETETS